MSPESCVVLVPVYSGIEPETEAGLRELANRGYPVRVHRGSSQVDFARSLMATAAMRDGFAETLWVDADTAFDPDDVERLREHNRPIVAGLYLKRGVRAFAAKFLPGEFTCGQGGGLIEVEAAGTGFLHVRREVYAALEKTLPDCSGGLGRSCTPYFMPLAAPAAGEWCYLGDDFAFCRRARDAGFAIHADTRIKLGHIGRKVWTWDDLQEPPPVESLKARFN